MVEEKEASEGKVKENGDEPAPAEPSSEKKEPSLKETSLAKVDQKEDELSDEFDDLDDTAMEYVLCKSCY